MGPCKGLCKDGRQSSQEVGGPGVCAVGEQKVGTLQVRDCGDAVEEHCVLRSGAGEGGLDVCEASDRGAEDLETLFGGRESLVTYPDPCVLPYWLDGVNVSRGGARFVPDPGFALVQVDPRVLENGVTGDVEGGDRSFWRGEEVDVV